MQLAKCLDPWPTLTKWHVQGQTRSLWNALYFQALRKNFLLGERAECQQLDRLVFHRGRLQNRLSPKGQLLADSYKRGRPSSQKYQRFHHRLPAT